MSDSRLAALPCFCSVPFLSPQVHKEDRSDAWRLNIKSWLLKFVALTYSTIHISLRTGNVAYLVQFVTHGLSLHLPRSILHYSRRERAFSASHKTSGGQVFYRRGYLESIYTCPSS